MLSNDADNKLWMKYLEKRLEIISLHACTRSLEKQRIFSVVHFYEKNLQKEYFWNVYPSCTNKFVQVQTDIFGTICASPKKDENIPLDDRCAEIPIPKMRDYCYRLRGK